MAKFELSTKVKGYKLATKAVAVSEYHTAGGHVRIDLRTCTQAEADRAVKSGRFKHLVHLPKPKNKDKDSEAAKS